MSKYLDLWRYTAEEKATIDRAFGLASRIAEQMPIGSASRLRNAFKAERKDRGDATEAKAMVALAFERGLRFNPKASDLAWVTPALAAATILGADARRLREWREPPAELAEFRIAAGAAEVANDARTARGRRLTLAGIGSQAAQTSPEEGGAE